MWICPVCNRKNEENLLCCPACSFDASSNYENFNTLNSLAEGTAAISRRKESAIESTIKSSNRIDWPNVTGIPLYFTETVVLPHLGTMTWISAKSPNGTISRQSPPAALPPEPHLRWGFTRMERSLLLAALESAESESRAVYPNGRIL